jgi:hypothetical protein
MTISEIKDLMIRSLEDNTNTSAIPGRMEEEGIYYNFSRSFGDKVLNKLYSAGLTVNREVENIKFMNRVFYRIAFTGVAAIVVMLISIFFMEGSLSFNSFLGLKDNFDESIICLLTGK